MRWSRDARIAALVCGGGACAGNHWGMATFHPTLPRGARVRTSVRGTLEQILLGPAHENDGRMNLFGALRTAMATCGYATVKEFQKAEVMIAPALQTEGKALRARRCGDGSLSTGRNSHTDTDTVLVVDSARGTHVSSPGTSARGTRVSRRSSVTTLRFTNFLRESRKG